MGRRRMTRLSRRKLERVVRDFVSVHSYNVKPLSEFVDRVESYMKRGLPLELAVERAVKRKGVR